MKLLVQAAIVAVLALTPFTVMADNHGHSHGEEAAGDLGDGDSMEAAHADHAKAGGKKKAAAKKKVAKKAKKAKGKKSEKM